MPNRQQQEQEALEVKGPGGLGLTFKGGQVFPLILSMAICGGLYLMVKQHDDNTKSSSIEVAATMKELKEAVKTSEETQRAMIYVMSLPQTERERLNLLKPKSLSDMQR